MASEDLSSYVKSSIDFYDLLGISIESSQKELDRAWRKTALKYHPDKVGPDSVAKDKFHLAQIGYDLLSNASSKQIYDNARNARLQRQREHEQHTGKRREMVENLEARERGVKRTWEETAQDDEEKLRRELQRIAEDGKRRRKEREENLRQDLHESEKKSGPNAESEPTRGSNGCGVSSGVPELERTVKVRWPADAAGGSRTAVDVSKLFSKFGDIESADLLNAKPVRLKTSKKKQMAYTCVLMYKSIVGAHAAVEDFNKQTDQPWQLFDSVRWALDKEPDFISRNATNGASDSAPSTPSVRTGPAAFVPRRYDGPSNATGSPQSNGNTLKQKPSFASFSAAAMSTPKGSSFGRGLGPNSPSLEEMTLIRLRKLEQKRLEAEIEQQEREADASGNSADNGST